MGAAEKCRVVDDYGQKLANSGFTLEQVRRILVNGIKGFQGRKLRCKREGRKLYRTAKQSQGARLKKKLLSKTSWYKGAKKNLVGEDDKAKKRGGVSNKGANTTIRARRDTPKTVLFVEHTAMGELARRLRELMGRLAPIMGFNVKVVERTGSSIKSLFSQSSLWDGAQCGRDACITCTQGAEMLPPCTRKSLVYENVCSICNEGAGAKKELTNINPEIASIYVGETSRTVQERAKEHWADTRGAKGVEGSHMLKHMEQYHGGEKPKFIMRVVQFHRSALSRQTGEAVRIMRRGGAGSVLNSKSEFNRCYIPRLKVEEQDKIKKMEQQEEDEMRAIVTALREEDEVWERSKNVKKTGGAITTGSSTKRGSQSDRN